MTDKLVVDANVVISSLITSGIPSKVFILNSKLSEFDFIAPEFLLEEVKKHEDRLIKLTKFSKEEFDKVYKFLMDEIILIPKESFKEFEQEAKQLSPHDKDIPYVALSLAVNCPIFSGDKGLLNSKAEVLSPRQVLDILESA